MWHALRVLPNERSRVVWTGALFFVLLASASIGLNAADALFFLRFGVDSLPLMIMLSGVAVMVVTIGYSAGNAIFGIRAWSWTVMLWFAAWLFAERLAIGIDAPGTYPAVWLTGQVVIYVGFTLLWDVAGELADARQAKRLFPLFMSAGIAGAVTGNALTGPLAGLLGTENLLVVQSIGLALAGFFARVTTQRFVNRNPDSSTGVVADLRSGLRNTLHVPLFRLVAGVGAALSVLFFLVFFPFSEVATDSFATEEALAGFLGWFSSVATAATFLVSLLVANRLFTRLGVVSVLLIVAIVYVAGFALWLLSFGLATATLFRGLQWVAINALGATAFSSLFNVLTGDARAQTREFVAAVPVQLGTILGGALLLVTSLLSATGRTVLSLAIAVGFLLMVLPMRRAYASALIDAVRQGLASVFTASMPGAQKPHHDADTLAALTAALHDPDPARRRVSAAILADVGGAASTSELRRLLSDGDEAVRLQALASLSKLDDSVIGADAVRLVDDPSVRVRRRAIALVSRSHADSPSVRRALEDADAEVRAHAARIIGGHVGRRIIDEMIAGEGAEAVAAALRCVIAEPDLAPVDGRRFVDHEDSSVRSLAAELLGTRRDSVATLRRLIEDSAPEVRQAAARALALADADAIHDVLVHGTVRARETALRAVLATPGHDDFLDGWAANELDRAAELHRYRGAIETRFDGASVAAEYLARVLARRERMVERWVVMALGSPETRAALPLVARGAISGESEVKAEALEAIESIADRTLARRLVSLLEDPGDESPPDRLRALRNLAADHQPWFRALAVRTMAEEFRQDLATALATAATDESALVRGAVSQHQPAPETPTARATVVDIVLALQQASILADLEPEVLEALASRCEHKRYAPGLLVYEQGSIGDELMVVISGTAIARIVDGDASRVIAEAGPGSPFGELSVLRQQPRNADVVAGPDGLQAIVIGGRAFMAVLREQPEMATALLANLAERIVEKVDPKRAGDSALISQS